MPSFIKMHKAAVPAMASPAPLGAFRAAFGGYRSRGMGEAIILADAWGMG